MCRKGLNSVKTGSKWAQNTWLCTPNGPGPLLEKRVFDPLVTHFWSQNNPFSRHTGIFHGPKPVPMGWKWARNTCLSIPNGPVSLLEKRVFDPFLTHFWSQNNPFSRHYGIVCGPKRVTMGAKWAKNTCLSIPNGPRLLLEKCVFDLVLTHFWSQNGLFSRHIGIFHHPKRVTTSSKQAKATCLSIPSGLRTTSEKMIFFRLGDPGGPTVGPHRARAELPCGAPGRGRQDGRCPPKTAHFVPQNSLFWPKTVPKPTQNGQTKGNGCKHSTCSSIAPRQRAFCCPLTPRYVREAAQQWLKMASICAVCVKQAHNQEWAVYWPTLLKTEF